MILSAVRRGIKESLLIPDLGGDNGVCGSKDHIRGLNCSRVRRPIPPVCKKPEMKKPTVLFWLVLAFASLFRAPFHSAAKVFGQETEKPKPIRALLIAGGCCHDYARQQEAICKGIQARANVRVDVYWTDNSTTAPVLPLYKKLNWAEDYDVIIHDECAADIKDAALVNRIVQVHQEIPAVHLHCAMHSFRTGTDAWFKHLGLQSSGHGPQRPIDIKFSKHPITETLKDWTTINEELYNNVKVFGAQSLATGTQELGGKNPRTAEAIVAWVNESAGARSFSTTIGHNTETVQDARYLELITRGLLWSCGKLNDDYLQPYEGENETTFIDKTKVGRRGPNLGNRPADSMLVLLSASGSQNGHPPFHAIDGKLDSRWCADGGSYPQSLTLEFEKPVHPEGIELIWEFPRAYRYQVEGSMDGNQWQGLLDQSQATEAVTGLQSLSVGAEGVRFLRVTGEGAPPGSWCSIREIKLAGPGLKKLWPAQKNDQQQLVPLQANAYEKSGNIPPRIEPLTAQQEAAILQDVQVPEGFEATVFAAPPAVNYPVFVAASVDGTLFVSSDGNGSLGRDPERGRVIRLRDLDGDGRADETKVFCEVDAPRGLVWDHDRLYLMHPPHLSVFIDRDGDGVADVQKTLVKNLAFGYDKRPADHTTNGLSLGVDGWLYIAGGDFGFMDAEGADGTRLTHRGGGVIRVRPDGSGLEVFSTGTRNILEVAISPEMEMFARDNTNDGGGWDVRLHHFTGNDDHGYPRLYKNFNDECVQPLADYGGGSGCGAVYLEEPGWGRWNDAPLTADWGTGALYRHTVQPEGATYQETAAPQPLVKMTRPTDADVDGNSRLYCASWKGATFNWAGPNVGYIVCVRPKGFQPTPMPDFEKASDQDLVSNLDSDSYRRRMEAQRELMRRGNSAAQTLLDKGLARRSELRNLLDRMQDAQDPAQVETCLQNLEHDDPVVVHTAIRCLAKAQASTECLEMLDQEKAPAVALLRALAMMHQSPVVQGLIDRLSSSDRDRRLQMLQALCRLHYVEGEWKGDSWGTRPDTRGPYYQPEPWAETTRIADTLNYWLGQLPGPEAAELLQIMQANRIQTDQALDRLLKLAQSDSEMLPLVLSQLKQMPGVPNEARGLLESAIHDSVSDAVLEDIVVCLAKDQSGWAASPMLNAMTALQGKSARAIKAFRESRLLESHLPVLVEALEDSEAAPWAAAGLLAIGERKSASPEAKETANARIAKGWNEKSQRLMWMEAAQAVGSHHLDQQIWSLREDENPELARAARTAIENLKITPAKLDQTPRIGTLALVDAARALQETKGDVDLGRQVFTRANCNACHTLTQDEPQKGPYLGNIAKTYKRPELATAVLEPSKTIAQGFATNLFLTIDGQLMTGFVTDEQSDRVSLRDQDGKETTLMKEDIEERKTSETSVMPAGLLKDFTVHEAASLLDFLESIAQ